MESPTAQNSAGTNRSLQLTARPSSSLPDPPVHCETLELTACHFVQLINISRGLSAWGVGGVISSEHK